jgi:hypothetical protein
MRARGGRTPAERRLASQVWTRSRSSVALRGHYFLRPLACTPCTYLPSMAPVGRRVVAVFFRTLYLANGESYGRSDSGFELSTRAHTCRHALAPLMRAGGGLDARCAADPPYLPAPLGCAGAAWPRSPRRRLPARSGVHPPSHPLHRRARLLPHACPGFRSRPRSGTSRWGNLSQVSRARTSLVYRPYTRPGRFLTAALAPTWRRPKQRRRGARGGGGGRADGRRGARGRRCGAHGSGRRRPHARATVSVRTAQAAARTRTAARTHPLCTRSVALAVCSARARLCAAPREVWRQRAAGRSFWHGLAAQTRPQATRRARAPPPWARLRTAPPKLQTRFSTCSRSFRVLHGAIVGNPAKVSVSRPREVLHCGAAARSGPGPPRVGNERATVASTHR